MLMEVFSVFGVPHTIKSDNGPAFISNAFAAFAEKMGFKHQRITPIYPPANGGVERVMKDLNKVVRCAQINDNPIEEAIRTYLKQYHATPNSMTRLTPNEMMGFKDETEFPTMKLGRTATEIDEVAAKNDSQAKESMIKHANADKHTKAPQFKVNDTVMVKLDRTNKFQPIYDPSLISPYIISDINGTMITARRTNPPHEITRNCAFFRRVNFSKKSKEMPKSEEPVLIRLPQMITNDPWTIAQTTPPPTPAEGPHQFEFNEANQNEINNPIPAALALPIPVAVAVNRPGRPTGSRNQPRQVETSDRKLKGSSIGTAKDQATDTRSRSSSPTGKKRDALNGPYWRR